MTHAIATMTLARNETESILMQSSLSALCEHGFPDYLVDAGSVPSLIKFLSGHPHIHLYPESLRGPWIQAKAAIAFAVSEGAEGIIYTEPDKKDFFEYHLKGLVAANYNDREIILAAREQSSFETFPVIQQVTETEINQQIGKLIAASKDYCYGPFMMPGSFFSQLSDLPDDIGWGWRPYAFIRAFKMGIGVKFFEGNFNCPFEQRGDGEKEKSYRLKQLEENLKGLQLACQKK